ncbi:hypothetical protein FRC17_009210 [Serendipita sp. 399]|nr:hypothetical protein FRC17_009210 [Serendipita sp. 399]
MWPLSSPKNETHHDSKSEPHTGDKSHAKGLPAQIVHHKRAKIATSQALFTLHAVNSTSDKQGQNSTFKATDTCLQALSWPIQMIHQKQREDVVFIVLQVWVFGLGVAAVINNSVPHVLATVIGHLSIIVWTSIQLINVFAFQQGYEKLIKGANNSQHLGFLGKPGACDKQDPIPHYFQPQILSHLLLLGWNAFGFIGFLFFAYKLRCSFAWSTFKRIGASIMIERLYRMALMHLLFLQITLYFVIVSVALWIDQLHFGVIGNKTQKKGLDLLFFAAIETAAILFIFISFVVGILARILCFGRGLPQYLLPTDPIDNDDLHGASDVVEGFEPVTFPSRTALGDEENGRHGRSTSSGSQSRAHHHHRADSDATLTDPNASKVDILNNKKKGEVEEIVDVPLASATRAWNAAGVQR